MRRFARDFLLFGRPDCIVIVVDATVLERNHLAAHAVHLEQPTGPDWDTRLDQILTSRLFGLPITASELARPSTWLDATGRSSHG